MKFYAGILTNPFKGDEKTGLHIPMISKKEYDQIRLIRSGKSLRAVKHEKYNAEFPLRRTVICADCNTLLTGSSPRGKGGRYSYYHCHKRGCSVFGKSIPKHIIETEFLSYLRQITPKKQFLDEFRKVVLEVWKEKGSFFDDQSQKYQKRLNDLESKRKRIFEMREEGSYTKEEFIERKAEVENEVTAVKISMNEARIVQLDIEGALKYAETFIGALDRQWFDLPPQLRLRFQKLLFPEGIPYHKENGFGTRKLGLLFELNRLSDTSKSHLVALVRTSWNKIVEELRKWLELQKESSGSTDSSVFSLIESYSQGKWGKVA